MLGNCVICFERLTPADAAAVACGHVFHAHWHACKSYTCLFFNTADDAEAPASQALVGLSPERLRSRAEDMARQLKDALAEAASARAECSGLAHRLSARDDAARAATEQLEGERANVAALTEEARSLRSDLHLEQTRSRKVVQQLQALQRDAIRARERHADLERELSEVRAEASRAGAAARVATNAKVAAEQELERAQRSNSIGELRAQELACLRAELAAARKKVEQLQERARASRKRPRSPPGPGAAATDGGRTSPITAPAAHAARFGTQPAPPAAEVGAAVRRRLLGAASREGSVPAEHARTAPALGDADGAPAPARAPLARAASPPQWGRVETVRMPAASMAFAAARPSLAISIGDSASVPGDSGGVAAPIGTATALETTVSAGATTSFRELRLRAGLGPKAPEPVRPPASNGTFIKRGYDLLGRVTQVRAASVIREDDFASGGSGSDGAGNRIRGDAQSAASLPPAATPSASIPGAEALGGPVERAGQRSLPFAKAAVATALASSSASSVTGARKVVLGKGMAVGAMTSFFARV